MGKGTTVVLDDDHLLFVDLASPETVANLRRNPALEINVVDQVVRKGYRFKGTAGVVDDPGRLQELVRVYDSEGSMLEEVGKRARAAVVVRVKRAAPLVSPGYDWISSEDEMREHWVAYWREFEETRE